MGVVTGAAAAFNGGTITKALKVHDLDPSAIAVEIDLDATNEDALLIRLPASYNARVVEVLDNNGNRAIQEVVNLGSDYAYIEVDQPSGGAGFAYLATDTGLVCKPSTATGKVLDVGTATGLQKLAFYGSAGAAQQTLTSGTATTAQIVQALQAYGLIGGT